MKPLAQLTTGGRSNHMQATYGIFRRTLTHSPGSEPTPSPQPRPEQFRALMCERRDCGKKCTLDGYMNDGLSIRNATTKHT